MDLTVLWSGEEKCSHGHCFGPDIKKGYKFHYIISGKGIYNTPQGSYHLHAEQAFLIFPGVTVHYQADETDPWHYIWVGFCGNDAPELIQATGLSRENPIITVEAADEVIDCLRTISHDIRMLQNNAAGRMAGVGGVLRFIALLSQRALTTGPADAYYEKAMWYIGAHLEHDISVEDIASFVGLSRCQLFRIFKAVSNQSPSKAIAVARALHARTLLKTTDLTISQIASSCGYANESHLSTAFKRDCQLSPDRYRKQCVQAEGG